MKKAPQPQFHMVVPDDFFVRIDEWRRAQPDIPSRTEAVRRLIELGLAAGQSKMPKAKGKSK